MNLAAFLPELYFSAVAGVFFVLALARRARPRRDYTAALALAGVGVLVTLGSAGMEGSLFAGAYRVDAFSQILKVLIAAGLFLVVWLSPDPDIPEPQRPEFHFLLTTSTLGMIFLVSSVELLTLYVSLELTSYSLYVLVPLREMRSAECGVRNEERLKEEGGRRKEEEERRKAESGWEEVRSEECGVRSEEGQGSARPPCAMRYAPCDSGLPIEAGMKYFLIGAITSSVMLFGLACLYGAAGTTSLAALSSTLPTVIRTPLGFVGVFFTLAGFFFKLAFFPFHVWGPTVYEAASNQVTAFIATVTKVMAIAMAARIIACTGGSDSLAQLLLVLSVASMTLGNLAALVQQDIKRLLAYSAISHAGYVLVGILSMTPQGYTAALFYAGAYMVMTVVCFLVVIQLSSTGRNLRLADLAGLHRRSPLLAMALMAGVFSLGGIPPTIGFTAKFLVFTAAMEKGHLLLVLIAMANVALSLYYYIQIIRAAYLLEPAEESPAISLSVPGRLITLALVVIIVLGGIFPSFFYGLAAQAAAVLP